MNGLTNQSFQRGLNTSQKTGINKQRNINQEISQVKRDRSETITSLNELNVEERNKIGVTSEELIKERAKRENEKKMLGSNVDFEGFESLAESSFKSYNNTPNFEQWQVLFKSNKTDLKSNEDGETTDESAPSSLESRDGRIRTRSDSVNSDISNITSFSEVSRDSVKSIFTGASNNSNKYLNSKETFAKVSNSFANNLSKIREDES